METASGLPATINTIISSPFYAGLVVAAIVGIVSVVWRSAFRQRRRFGWSLLYDEPINQSGQTPWEIQYHEGGADAPEHTVRNGSLVAMDMRNIGRLPILESDFGEDRYFRVKFPGRKVVNYKVRDHALYHDKVRDSPQAAPVPGEGNFFDLPALQMNHGDSFKLLVLLEAETETPPYSYAKPVLDGTIQGGGFVEFGQRRHSRLYSIAAIAVLILAFGGYAGASIANSAQEPTPVCGTGTLTIAGSTAFAPVFTQVAREYEQQCPGANIVVNPDGSGNGLTDLHDGSAGIAMYDGSPPSGQIGAHDVSQRVGDVIFAVVGNNRSLPKSDFTPGTGNGLTAWQITQAFGEPNIGGFQPVGRVGTSGTREAFRKSVLVNQVDTAENNARQCPSSTQQPVVRGLLCLEPTTLALLNFVNQAPRSIGYGEADALPFFPNVGEIPVNGYEPTRQNVLDGNYNFLAPEHLYTKGQPSGLAEDLVSFLTSSPVTAQLRATSSFIACSDLIGTKHAADCQGS